MPRRYGTVSIDTRSRSSGILLYRYMYLARYVLASTGRDYRPAQYGCSWR